MRKTSYIKGNPPPPRSVARLDQESCEVTLASKEEGSDRSPDLRMSAFGIKKRLE